MGNSRELSSISFLLIINESKAPRTLPISIVISRITGSMSFTSPPRRIYAGTVKATPPATIEPALIIV